MMKNDYFRLPFFNLAPVLLMLGAALFTTEPSAHEAPPMPGVRGDSVQAVLWNLSAYRPDLVAIVPETGRLYLKTPHASAVPEAVLARLEDAFYHDVAPLCKLYAWKYLADWQALAGKSARETFWGTSYLCNRTFNYFGIWRKNKSWICRPFGFCRIITRNDPSPAEFVVFPNFEASLWMFIHTIYSSHYLQRLPDWGDRVQQAIRFERRHGVRYWTDTGNGPAFDYQIPGTPYSSEELIHTWSGHEGFNLCVQCSPETDFNWMEKISMVADRARD
jgi:hypothetical protein